jgi:hypothetical protein
MSRGRLVVTDRSSGRCSLMMAGGGVVRVETGAVRWRAAMAISGGLEGGGSYDKEWQRGRLLVPRWSGKKHGGTGTENRAVTGGGAL